jgi:hypothetical protein
VKKLVHGLNSLKKQGRDEELESDDEQTTSQASLTQSVSWQPKNPLSHMPQFTGLQQ